MAGQGGRGAVVDEDGRSALRIDVAIGQGPRLLKRARRRRPGRRVFAPAPADLQSKGLGTARRRRLGGAGAPAPERKFTNEPRVTVFQRQRKCRASFLDQGHDAARGGGAGSPGGVAGMACRFVPTAGVQLAETQPCGGVVKVEVDLVQAGKGDGFAQPAIALGKMEQLARARVEVRQGVGRHPVQTAS